MTGARARGATAMPPAQLLRLHRHSRSNLLVLGGSETQRVAAARAFHRTSPSGAGPFLFVNCAREEWRLRRALECWLLPDEAQPDSNPLRESEHGTLYLESVGRLSAPTQRLLLALTLRLQASPMGGPGAPGPYRLAVGDPGDLAEAVEDGHFSGALLDSLDKIRVVLGRAGRRGAA